MKYVWDEEAWNDYCWWQVQDRKVLKRINVLLRDIARNGNDGMGKPEALEHGFRGYWLRRITDEHRLIYKIEHEEIRIAGCRYHYGLQSGPPFRSTQADPAPARISPRVVGCQGHVSASMVTPA